MNMRQLVTPPNPTRIAHWNELAGNLGRLGFLMAERFAAVRPTLYGRLDAEQGRLETIFDLFEADERHQSGGWADALPHQGDWRRVGARGPLGGARVAKRHPFWENRLGC